jgi:hypothetical protein
MWTTSSWTCRELLPALVHHIVNTLGWPGLRPLQAEAIDPAARWLRRVPAGADRRRPDRSRCVAAAHRNGRAVVAGQVVLYVCPLRALLNDLQPRLATYTGWPRRTAEVWHVDVGSGARERVRREPPNILMTTPESTSPVRHSQPSNQVRPTVHGRYRSAGLQNRCNPAALQRKQSGFVQHRVRLDHAVGRLPVWVNQYAVAVDCCSVHKCPIRSDMR